MVSQAFTLIGLLPLPMSPLRGWTTFSRAIFDPPAHAAANKMSPLRGLTLIGTQSYSSDPCTHHDANLVRNAGWAIIATVTEELSYRGWVRPGPVPPGGIEPAEGETLDYLCGHFRIFQYARGHRYSTDDVLTAYYGTQWAPRVERAADLGAGIGSVAMIAAWRLPGARFCTVEAQARSVDLARKSAAYNGLADRFHILEGDLRDPALFSGEEPFDLVTGSPPYFPEGTATRAAHEQAVPARLEVRGSIHDYAAAASRILRVGGIFAFVFPTPQSDRALDALDRAGLVLLRRREVVFKEGEASVISLFAASRASDLPVSFIRPSPGKPWAEPPLIIRDREGRVHPEYATVRLSFGFPPGDVAGE